MVFLLLSSFFFLATVVSGGSMFLTQENYRLNNWVLF
jgi:hypothetical protein